MDGNVFFLVIQFLVLLLSLSIHESAHAWTADALGDPTARYLGRVSLNPIVHADPVGTILFPLMALFLLPGALFGWAKPVPVNLGRLKNPTRDHMLVAAAGPISNVLLALSLLICVLISKAVTADGDHALALVANRQIDAGSPILAPLMAFAYYGIIINVVLAVFNLIPVAPLDGAAVLGGLLPQPLAAVFEQMQAYGFMFLIALLYLDFPARLYTPVLDFVLSFLFV